ncbi:MAG: hypothetical protein H6Q31_1312 [Bacteroidetes bacterium]|nr:hypothetical protein [Bacteroidota bacterium]
MGNDVMSHRVLLWCVITLASAVGASRSPAQVSGFMSASYGYHRNPLYNYEMIPDQLRQSYLELTYAHPVGNGTISAGYVGGLMIFNAFTDRNYYEHNGRLTYLQAFGSIPRAPRSVNPESIDEEEGEEEKAEEEEIADTDSVRSYFDVNARIGGRHDKAVFREFDNIGTSLTAGYRFRIGSLFMRIHNDFGMRSYANLTELSNISDVLTVQLGRFSQGGLTAGVLAQGGIKHFTNDVYDTTRFESKRTYVVKDNGKGKGGAKLVEPSDKNILVNSATTTASQLAGGVFAGSSWTAGSLMAELLYRYNTGSGTRYLAQYANTSMLNEDIYNDFFSYDGPSGRIVYRQSLPLGLQSIVTVEAVRKRFSAPALNLNGDQIADNRIDLNGSADLWLSRYFELPGGLGLDVALSAGVVRNQSNDDYNDFSLSQFGMSLGVGF